MRILPRVLMVGSLLLASCTSSSDKDDAADSTSSASIDSTTTTNTQPAEDDARESETPAGRATIVRTSHNVPHVSADSYDGLGFGYGYAMAEDHMCTLAELAVQVRSEAAATFGEGTDAKWTNQDLVYKALDLQGLAQSDLEAADPDLRNLIDGFAEGINHYLEETGVESVPGYCQGEDWVGPVDAVDVAAFARRLTWLASITAMQDLIATATPPEVAATSEIDTSDKTGTDEHALAAFDDGLAAALVSTQDLGSNAWALGPDLTEDGTTMLAGNPHFPWQGSLRFYEAHLTIPGEMDVYGVSLLGSPLINIGFNKDVAWSHTVSDGRRFTVYTLPLSESSPTTYLYDGEEREMTSQEVEIDVLAEDGSTETISRSIYFSHYGPVINFPGLGWSEDLVLSMRDSNADNNEIYGQFLAMSKAGSMEELQEAHETWQGIPWVNTIAASADGRIWYADTASTPNLSAEAIAGWRAALESDILTQIALDNGVYLLDGSDPLYEWVDDPTSRDPGVEPYSAKPQLERSDYLLNANDPYWLANAEEFTQEASPLHGLFGSTISHRTRMAVLQIQRDGGSDGLFSLTELQDSVLGNGVLTAELILDEFLPYCIENSPDVELCTVLGDWDRTVNLDSPGAALWREFITTFSHAEVTDAGPLFVVAYDPTDPINTPNTLALSPDLIERLVAAAENLALAGFDIDATMRQTQAAVRGDVTIALHGGSQLEGVTNVLGAWGNDSTSEPETDRADEVGDSDSLTADGYGISGGTSFLYTIEFTADGPQAYGFLAYGNSGDPESEFFSDQTQLFADKEWKTLLFTQEDIAADPDARTYQVG